MKLDTSGDHTHSVRSWLWSPAIYLALGLLALATVVMAQTPETATPTAQQDAPATPDETLKTESSTGGCPCCSKESGQGRQGAAQGPGCHGRGQGPQGQGSSGQMRSPGRPEAELIHFLIDHHERLERTVEIIPGGVRTRTLSSDPEIVDAVRTHVRQMADLIHAGGRIRNWDPLFREVFDHREAIEMEITDIEGGVEVTETSDDDDVAELIRAHAAKVEDFVARGLAAYREETPLPEGYSDTRP